MTNASNTRPAAPVAAAEAKPTPVQPATPSQDTKPPAVEPATDPVEAPAKTI